MLKFACDWLGFDTYFPPKLIWYGLDECFFTARMELYKFLFVLGLTTENKFYFGISRLELQSKFCSTHTHLSTFLIC